MPKTSTDVYQEVTNTIIEGLENGTVPWHKPWRSTSGQPIGFHRNLDSKRPYRGINQFLLDIVAQTEGYSSPYWLTMKSIKKHKANLVKINGDDEPGTGQRSTLVVFWKPIQVEVKDGTGRVVIDDDSGKPKKRQVLLLRYYRVFNIEQTTIPVPEEEQKKTEDEFEPIERAQQILDNMPNAPRFDHRGSRACYSPFTDTGRMPKPEAFDTPEDYYVVNFHEHVHATGHESRLHRVKDWGSFGSEPYAKEELVAEMGAAMLARVAAIDGNDPRLNNRAAYIANWLGALKDDKKLVVIAAAQAQKAADYILGIKFDDPAPSNGEAK